MEKYGRDGQVTDDNIIRCKHFACCVTKATDTQPEFAIHVDFPQRQ